MTNRIKRVTTHRWGSVERSVIDVTPSPACCRDFILILSVPERSVTVCIRLTVQHQSCAKSLTLLTLVYFSASQSIPSPCVTWFCDALDCDYASQRFSWHSFCTMWKTRLIFVQQKHNSTFQDTLNWYLTENLQRVTRKLSLRPCHWTIQKKERIKTKTYQVQEDEFQRMLPHLVDLRW